MEVLFLVAKELSNGFKWEIKMRTKMIKKEIKKKCCTLDVYSP